MKIDCEPTIDVKKGAKKERREEKEHSSPLDQYGAGVDILFMCTASPQYSAFTFTCHCPVNVSSLL